MNRRELTTSLLSAIATSALLVTVDQRKAFAASVRPIAEQWLRGLHEMSRDLRASAISTGQWQMKADELFERVSFEELTARIEMEKLIRDFSFAELGVHTKDVRFPAFEGLPQKLAFHSKIFGMKKNRAIIPHGHRNMVSCHFVLKGDFRLRHYNRIADDETHMIIEPTVDKVVHVGNHSAISDEKNNVHWLTALSESAFTYDVIVADLGGKNYEIDNIDPADGEKIGGGRIRARKLSVDDALKKYGNRPA